MQQSLTVEHTDIQAAYDTTNQLSIVAFDVNHTMAYPSNEVVLVVAESAKTPLPAGTPFGPEGAPLWILPASQDPSLLYLGLSAEPPQPGRPGIPSGVFSGNLLFRLKSVDGPGDFFLWQSSGGYNIQMNTPMALTMPMPTFKSSAVTSTSIGALRPMGSITSRSRFRDSLPAQPTSPVQRRRLPLTCFRCQPTRRPANIQLTRCQTVAGGGSVSFNIVGAANRRMVRFR